MISCMGMDPHEIRRWVRSRREAEKRQLQELSEECLDTRRAIERSLELIDLTARFRGWPPPPDPIDEAEDMQAYLTWDRLRERWPR